MEDRQREANRIRRNRPLVEAESILVVRVKTARGCGVTYCTAPHTHEMVRGVDQYFSQDGKFLAEHDILDDLEPDPRIQLEKCIAFIETVSDDHIEDMTWQQIQKMAGDFLVGLRKP